MIILDIFCLAQRGGGARWRRVAICMRPH